MSLAAAVAIAAVAETRPWSNDSLPATNTNRSAAGSFDHASDVTAVSIAWPANSLPPLVNSAPSFSDA